MAEQIINAFSVDVEDGISIAMRDRFGKKIPQTERVVHLTARLLELLARHQVRGTFFVLGQVGEAYPELVRDIQSAGHEIGVHGHDHHVFDKLSAEQAKEELYRAKAVLEDITGEKMRGHRAPAFSVNERTAWVLDLLLDVGFEYDSSIMPCQGVGYGWPGQSLEIGLISTPAGEQIIEVPLSAVSLGSWPVPGLGGSYFRLLPFPITRLLFGSTMKKRPVIMYLHPYEIDEEPYPDFFLEELSKLPLTARVKQRVAWLRRSSVYYRYDRLLEKYQFSSIGEIIKSMRTNS